MAVRPSVPEIITVNSEELQTQIRDLLPSQNGFGSELQATNVITPIIDLTRAAEGSGLPIQLQNALSFGSQTSFTAANSTVTVVNTTGFFRVFGVCGVGLANTFSSFDFTDGLSVKTIYKAQSGAGATNNQTFLEFDFIVFCGPGESLTCTSSNISNIVSGSVRQVATGDGTLVSPNGFPI